MVAEPAGTRVCGCWEEQTVPLKSSLPLCARGRQGSLLETPAVTGPEEPLVKGGSAQTHTKSCGSTAVGTGGRQSGGASATQRVSEFTRDYSVTG